MINMLSNPAPFSNLKKSSNQWNFTSYENDRLFPPADGIITETSSECNGLIKIKHNVNGETIYSKFCGVGNISAITGQNVRKSNTIGYFGTKPIYFTLLDKRDKKLNIESFFTDIPKDKKSETKKSSYTPPTQSDDLAKYLIKATLGAPFIPFALLSKKDKSKIEEELTRIKKLLK